MPEENEQLGLYTEEMKQRDEIRKQRGINIAFNEANKYGVYGFAVGTVGTLLAMRRFPWFNTRMPASVKTAIPAMIGLFLWTVEYELVVIDAQR
jgi:hypothetical protein